MKLFGIIALALAATLFSAVPTESGPQGRITFGSIAKEGQFSYQVGLSRNDEDVWCGGSVLSNEWTMTAGHCAWGLPELYLHFGSNNFSAPLVTRKVSSSHIFVHTKYNSVTLENDIAVLHHQKVEYSHNIWPVALPSKGTKTQYVGEVAVASGWGATRSSYLNPWYLSYIHVNVISNENCAKYFGKDAIPNVKMCVSTIGGTSTCGGDSGGPLVIESTGVQIGITSFVPLEGCIAQQPAGFVRVTEYIDWIKEQTGIYS